MGKRTQRERELPEPHTRVPEPPDWSEPMDKDLAFERYREKQRRE
jgi:hypothetical protein